MTINFPNKLTLLRLALIPPFLIFTIEDNMYTRIAALLIFGFAGLTDLFDGKIARERKMVTRLGTFLDPLADKLLISAAFIAFVQIKEIYVPAWMVVLIIGREFLITGLRTLAASMGRVLPAQPAGKFKTTSQILVVIIILGILIANAYLEKYHGIPIGSLINDGQRLQSWGWFLTGGPYWLTFFAALFTILSGYVYLKDNIDLLDEKNA